MKHLRLAIVLAVSSLLFVALAGAASAATSSSAQGSSPQRATCSALDFHAPGWPLCFLGGIGGGNNNGGGTDETPVGNPPPTVIATQSATTGPGGSPIACTPVGNSGNLRCRVGTRTFVINLPRIPGVVVTCTQPTPNTLVCTYTFSLPATTTPGPSETATTVAASPTPRPTTAVATVTTTTPTTATATVGIPATETMVMPSTTATMTMPPGTTTATAQPSVTSTTAPIDTMTAVPPPVTTTAGPIDTATAGPSTTASTGPTLVPTAVPTPNPDLVELLRLVNLERANDGAPPLRFVDPLQAAAQGYARTMAANEPRLLNDNSNTTWHGVDGSDPFQRMSNAGCHYSAAAENVAAGYANAHDVMYGPDGRGGWMDSPGHRASILNPAYRVVGFGFVNQASGTFHTFWVQDFADAC